MLHNEADAEDVTQSTFLSAYRAFRRGDRPVKPHNWLIKIAHNECRQRFRASARRPVEVTLQESDGHSRPGLDEDVPTAEEIRHALAQLSFNQRAALVMRELEGRPYAEIAAVLETSVSAVETLLFRARRALREQLEGSLTCGQAEHALSRRLEGSLTQIERGPLRAHLRECKECSALERRQRAHRAALKSTLGAVPLPASLQSFIGGGAATVGGGAVLTGAGFGGKLAAVVAAGAVAVGAGHQAVQAVTKSPSARKGEIVLNHSAAPSFTPLARVQRAAPTRLKPAQKQSALIQAVKLEPAGKGAAHRRTLRPSEADEQRVDSSAPATSAPAKSVSPVPLPEPPPVAPPTTPLKLPAVTPPAPPLPACRRCRRSSCRSCRPRRSFRLRHRFRRSRNCPYKGFCPCRSCLDFLRRPASSWFLWHL